MANPQHLTIAPLVTPTFEFGPPPYPNSGVVWISALAEIDPGSSSVTLNNWNDGHDYIKEYGIDKLWICPAAPPLDMADEIAADYAPGQPSPEGLRDLAGRNVLPTASRGA